MPFPNVEGKHGGEAMFGPRDLIAYLRAQGEWADFPVPDGVVLFYQRWFLSEVVAREEKAGRLRKDRLPSALLSFHLIADGPKTIGLSGGFGIGSPAAATVVEELIEVGVKRFIGIGTAGSLQKSLGIGSIVVCDRAVRDEGVSHHYIRPSKYANMTPALTNRLLAELASHGVATHKGSTWTIDAPYRETIDELRHYQQEGVLVVDMEAAALASIAEYRSVEFAAAFTVSDNLADTVWNPQFRSAGVATGLHQLYASALAVLKDPDNSA